MSSLGRAALIAALVVAVIPATADARKAHRHKVYGAAHATSQATWHRAPPRYGYGYGGPYGPTSGSPYPLTAADDPYSPYAAPGAAVRAMAHRNQYAPGVTNELAPDNIATATGGPSGGVPGFSGR